MGLMKPRNVLFRFSYFYFCYANSGLHNIWTIEKNNNFICPIVSSIRTKATTLLEQYSDLLRDDSSRNANYSVLKSVNTF